MNPWEIAAGTGHRELVDGGEEWLRPHLLRCAVWLRDKAGTRVGISGLARGFDLWWADAILAADLELWAYIPFAEQTARWNRADRAEWERLRAAATKAPIIGVMDPETPPKQRSSAVNRLLHGRNTRMLRDAGTLVAGWESDKLDGGTHSVVLKAAQARMPGIHLDPITRGITFELPGLDRLVKQALYHGTCGCVAGVGILAEVEQRRSALIAAGYHQWRIRPARIRETYGAGCDTCRVNPTTAHLERELTHR